jgi:hypothetical protein
MNTRQITIKNLMFSHTITARSIRRGQERLGMLKKKQPANNRFEFHACLIDPKRESRLHPTKGWRTQRI